MNWLRQNGDGTATNMPGDRPSDYEVVREWHRYMVKVHGTAHSKGPITLWDHCANTICYGVQLARMQGLL